MVFVDVVDTDCIGANTCGTELDRQIGGWKYVFEYIIALKLETRQDFLARNIESSPHYILLY